MQFNLFLAIFWFLLALVLFAWPWFDPQAPMPLTIRGTGISAGWIGVVLGAFNLIRWWNFRSQVASRRAIEEAERQRREETRHRQPLVEPDARFDFGNVPPGGEDVPSS
jgi:hypothetical protein